MDSSTNGAEPRMLEWQDTPQTHEKQIVYVYYGYVKMEEISA